VSEMKYRLDLLDFIGNILLKGGQTMRNGSRPDGSDAIPVVITEHGFDTRNHLRYLFSDSPFGVKGLKACSDCGLTSRECERLAEEI
jgi:hypothetical protein